MSFGERLRARREELNMTRNELAAMLGISPSAIGNYEIDTNFPKEEILLRLFDCLDTDPNTLFRDSFRHGGKLLTTSERALLDGYRSLPPYGKETLRSILSTLQAYQAEAAEPVEAEPRTIPLYLNPAAAGYAAPAFGEDFEYLTVEDDVPPAAEFAVRIQGDSMAPYLADGSVAYVNRDPLKDGDVGIFCVDGGIVCKQYHRDPAGIVYLFSLNRARSDADVVLLPSGNRTLACFGRVILHAPPLPGYES